MRNKPAFHPQAASKGTASAAESSQSSAPLPSARAGLWITTGCPWQLLQPQCGEAASHCLCIKVHLLYTGRLASWPCQVGILCYFPQLKRWIQLNLPLLPNFSCCYISHVILTCTFAALVLEWTYLPLNLQRKAIWWIFNDILYDSKKEHTTWRLLDAAIDFTKCQGVVLLNKNGCTKENCRQVPNKPASSSD